MKKCILFGASSVYSYRPIPNEGVYVIAVDGGYKSLQKLNIKPDLIVGDFDSMEKSELDNKVISEPIIELEKEKDDTDTLFALRKGIEEGYKEFHLFGCTGGRLSHTLANIQCLAFLSERGARGFLYGKDYVLTVIRNANIEFESEMKGYISVFAHTEVSKGVSIEGLKYELNNAELSSSFPIGVSNEFVGKKSKISVDEGALIVVYPSKKRRIII